MVYVYRLATPAIAAQLPFQEKHMENFFTPINEGLQRVGASQFCSRDVRSELGGSQSYDVERIVDRQPAQDPVKVGQISDLRERLNLLQPPPPATDLDEGCENGREGGSLVDTSMWARTSLEDFLSLTQDVPTSAIFAVRYKLTPNRPSHLMVFGPGDFHLCSCLRLLQHGLPCRHYFAVLLSFIGEKDLPGSGHTFNVACVHNRWRQAPDVDDKPWSVSFVLGSTGHGGGWDGLHDNDDDVAPIYDNNGDMDGALPQDARKVADQRRAFATMMAKSKENVSEILRSVNTAEALEIQRAVDECVKFQLTKRLGMLDGTAIGPGNPEMAPKKGRPKGSTKQATGTIGQSKARSRNPEGQMGTTLKKTRFRDSYGPGSGRGRRARGDGQSASGNAS
ncbi:unnamed protein product [Ectocarpus sp. CCAP 1310/34]|nr:unnamed protein product [Ectocarpus sp. CCAP 1310/34]